jgi:hypothetical protein
MHLFTEVAGLADTMPGLHGVTFLASTNDALPSQESLPAAGNEDTLSAVLGYHIVESMVDHTIHSISKIVTAQTS